MLPINVTERHYILYSIKVEKDNFKAINDFIGIRHLYEKDDTVGRFVVITNPVNQREFMYAKIGDVICRKRHTSDFFVYTPIHLATKFSPLGDNKHRYLPLSGIAMVWTGDKEFVEKNLDITLPDTDSILIGGKKLSLSDWVFKCSSGLSSWSTLDFERNFIPMESEFSQPENFKWLDLFLRERVIAQG